MPKLFPIHIEVEELAVGRVMRLLNNTPGVAKMNLQMAKPNGEFKPRKPYKRYGKAGLDFVKEALSKAPRTNAELVKQFIAEGRSQSSVSPILTGLTQGGLATRDEKTGKYSLTKKAREQMRKR